MIFVLDSSYRSGDTGKHHRPRPASGVGGQLCSRPYVKVKHHAALAYFRPNDSASWQATVPNMRAANVFIAHRATR